LLINRWLFAPPFFPRFLSRTGELFVSLSIGWSDQGWGSMLL
jgi:hypothetical protein